ncbi:hypothetical protein LTR56_019215 [Elasticomyces elasticus]|nr:hypothetical protein LTR56_019215 [Elasticomyces elasticus]KAK3633223.1 hypothetical protein LTR22_020223 [Elasticomyces elasticus]KAK4910618.1 hypothetical protein LTR49_020750 [Elasticomyces elasticus]KAK5751029.1 hypothetical protein LTS12_018930 [Elasticomyces elasticus]
MEDPQPCILVRLNNAEHTITGLKDEVAQLKATLAQSTGGDKALKAMQATVDDCDEASAAEGEPTSVSNLEPAEEAQPDLAPNGRKALRAELFRQMEEMRVKMTDPAVETHPSRCSSPEVIKDELDEMLWEKLIETHTPTTKAFVKNRMLQGEDKEAAISVVLDILRRCSTEVLTEEKQSHAGPYVDNLMRRVEVILRAEGAEDLQERKKVLDAEFREEEEAKAKSDAEYGEISGPNIMLMRKFAKRNQDQMPKKIMTERRRKRSSILRPTICLRG